jgi:hypothetical protein
MSEQKVEEGKCMQIYIRTSWVGTSVNYLRNKLGAEAWWRRPQPKNACESTPCRSIELSHFPLALRLIWSSQSLGGNLCYKTAAWTCIYTRPSKIGPRPSTRTDSNTSKLKLGKSRPVKVLDRLNLLVLSWTFINSYDTTCRLQHVGRGTMKEEGLFFPKRLVGFRRCGVACPSDWDPTMINKQTTLPCF